MTLQAMQNQSVERTNIRQNIRWSDHLIPCLIYVFLKDTGLTECYTDDNTLYDEGKPTEETSSFFQESSQKLF